jgi:hypothetical protein
VEAGSNKRKRSFPLGSHSLTTKDGRRDAGTYSTTRSSVSSLNSK